MTRSRHRGLIAGVLAGLALAAPAPATASPAPDPVISSWVEYEPRMKASARAITLGSNCPRIEVDGRSRRMSVRSEPDPPDFPNLVCEQRLGANARSVELAGRSLPVPNRRSRRIVIVGDAGCRGEVGDPFQACRDPAQWPFATVARSIKRWDPQAIVHVGDYLYREDPCPQGNSGCAGSPSGDNFATWQADFFEPAAPMLRTAPITFTRGNHEECKRNYIGWFRYLYQRAEPSGPCPEYTPPFPVPLGKLRILNLDSSQASDSPAKDPEPYVPQFERLEAMARGESWFHSHRPLWGLAPDKGGTEFDPLNETLQAASGNELPPEVTLAVNGHVHLAEVLDYSGDRPSQIIMGVGGTGLDDDITAPVVGTDVAGETIEAATIQSIFGYATMVRRSFGWRMKLRDVDGGVLSDCTVSGRDASCKTG